MRRCISIEPRANHNQDRLARARSFASLALPSPASPGRAQSRHTRPGLARPRHACLAYFVAAANRVNLGCDSPILSLWLPWLAVNFFPWQPGHYERAGSEQIKGRGAGYYFPCVGFHHLPSYDDRHLDGSDGLVTACLAIYDGATVCRLCRGG
jgi:hypothetical protein